MSISKFCKTYYPFGDFQYSTHWKKIKIFWVVGCGIVGDCVKLIAMSNNNNTEMNQIISSIIRSADEAEYFRLVSEGTDEATAYEQAVNSNWELSDEDIVLVTPEGDAEFTALDVENANS